MSAWRAPLRAVAAVLLTGSALLLDAARVQGQAPDTVPTDSVVTPPPRGRMYHAYRPGERLEYVAHVGIVGDAGRGLLTVNADTVGDVPVYRVALELHASTLFGALKVDDVFQSWLDPATMRALRFEKQQDEPRTHTHEVYEFLPAEGEWRRSDGSDETGPLATENPLDDVSFIYYVRALPLRVGTRYVLHDYFKESGNPIVLDIVRKETVTVPAGQFQTIVVRPTIQTKGLFGQGGRAELFLTDDAYHLPVMLRARLPVLRTLEFRLQSFTLGR